MRREYSIHRKATSPDGRTRAEGAKLRSFGSTALDIAYIAAGRVGAFVQMGTNLWDFAAAAAILKEAGGILEAEEYTRGRWKVIAGNPGTFAEVRR